MRIFHGAILAREDPILRGMSRRMPDGPKLCFILVQGRTERVMVLAAGGDRISGSANSWSAEPADRYHPPVS